MAFGLGAGPVPVANAAWLAGLCFVVHRVEFDVGEGRTRPVQLVLIPMLCCSRPPGVPLLIAVALHRSRGSRCRPRVASGRASLLQRSPTAGSALARRADPGDLGLPGTPGRQRGRVALAVAAQVSLDFVVAAARLRFGLGMGVRDQLGGVRLGLSRRRAAHAGRPSSPRSSAWTRPSTSRRSCRSPPCLPSSRASGGAGSRTRWSSTASSRRASSGCSRSSRTRPT